VLTAEHAGEVHGMNVDRRGNLAERQFLVLLYLGLDGF
jgi:hypothetical protein